MRNLVEAEEEEAIGWLVWTANLSIPFINRILSRENNNKRKELSLIVLNGLLESIPPYGI